MAEISVLDERRGAYRVQPTTADELDLVLLAKRQRLVRAVIDDVAFGGARIRIDKAAAADLCPGERINVAIACSRLDYECEVPARVVALSTGEREATVRLAFERGPVDLGELGGAVYSLFNRRTTVRGPLLPGSPDLHAQVSSNEINNRHLRTYTVDVRNISNVGVTIRVNARVNEALHAVNEIMLSLQLPDRPERSRVACHVRRRYVDGANFIYGCEYDWSATNDALCVIEDLVDYVLERSEASRPPAVRSK